MNTEPYDRAVELRKTLVQGDKILAVNFASEAAELQGKDTSKAIELMPVVRNGVITNEYIGRSKVNVKDIDPIASQVYNLSFKDPSKMSPEDLEDFLRKQTFDFPLWFKHVPGFDFKNIHNFNPPYIMQVAGCNFHDGSASGGCWYCFVDDKSNDGKPGEGKTYVSIDEVIDSALYAREELRKEYAKHGVDYKLKVLRISGGEPTIALDWIAALWQRIEERGLDFVGHLDTNLSTARFITENFPEAMDKLAKYPIKVLTAIKGVDDINLEANVQSNATIQQQINALKLWVGKGFDIFPQMYNPNPMAMYNYLYMMDGIIENFSRRVHIGPLKLYGPTTKRLQIEAQKIHTGPDRILKIKQEAWDNNYQRGCIILDDYLKKQYGVGYKQETRSDVKLKLK
ncbi:MAG: radical SAM protein [Candidatus Woesearchaeota archaeon]